MRLRHRSKAAGAELRAERVETLTKQLNEILTALPVLDAQRCHIPDKVSYLIAWSERAGRPRAIKGGRAVVENEIGKFLDAIFDLNKLFHSFHRDTLHTIGGYDRSPQEIFNELLDLYEPLFLRAFIGMQSVQADARLTDARELKSVIKKRERQIAQAAILVFQDLTGKRATISVKRRKQRGVPGEVAHQSGGAALKFVKDVYKVFEINASAEAQLAAVTKPKKNRHQLMKPKERRARKRHRKLLSV